ncbi:class A sortase [Facklamia hominis]
MKKQAPLANRQSRRYRHKRKKRFSFTTFIGVLLILFALSLLSLNPIKNYLIAKNSQAITASSLTREQILANQQKDVTFDINEVRAIDPIEVITSGVNPKNLPVIGGIAIPDLKINLPINKGTTNAGMYYGAGTLRPDQVMGQSNYILSSHHSVKPNLLFAPLMHAKEGQLIYLTDLDKIYVYQTYNVMTVHKTTTEVLNPTSEPIVTLITCDSPDLTANRVIVQGKLIKTVDIKDADEAMVKAFDMDQTIFKD